MAKASDIDELDCTASASEGIALVLRTRLAEMCALRTAALDWSDPEGVHDMRVASRRLRSALRDFAPYLRRRLPRRRLRRLAAALGAVRDEDVALIALEALAREAADADITSGLSLLVAARQERRAHARAMLTLALAEPALDAWQTKLMGKLSCVADEKHARVESGAGDDDTSAFIQAGREIIASLSAELFAEGRALYQPQRVKRIHQLRIIAKRLRYAMELFAQCWGARLTACADEIAALQKSLGELHDCDVWIAELGGLLKQSCKPNKTEAAVAVATRAAEHKAAVWLLARFVKERAKHFRAALDGWETLCANDFRTQLLSTLLQAPGKDSLQAAPSSVSSS